jgi:hypothetical protein
MLITFKEMQRRVGRRLQNTATSTTNANDILPKIKDFCNERYHRILRSHPFEEGLGDTTLTIVASTRAYALDRNIDKIWTVFDQTNGQVIKITGSQDYVRHYAIDFDQTGNVVTGDPTRFYPVGKYTVKAILPAAAAEKVSVVSTSASDITPLCVRVRGLVSGVDMAEDITLTGATAADSANTYDANQKLTIVVGTIDGTAPAAVGKITVSGKTSSTVFSQIFSNEQATPYQWIEVSPLPKASGTQPTWKLFYGRRITPLVNNNDIPIIDCCNEIVQGAFVDCLKEDGQDNLAAMEEQNWVGMVNELISTQDIPGRIEQFMPQDTELIQSLDYSRVYGGAE